MARLLEKTGKGRFRITQRGKETIASNPPSMNQRFLFQFPEYAEARGRAKTDAAVEPAEHPPAIEVANWRSESSTTALPPNCDQSSRPSIRSVSNKSSSISF
jgi:restriction system protein